MKTYTCGRGLSGKQRISLSANFPVHVNEGKLVYKADPLSSTKFPACISYDACGKFRRQRKHFPLARAMRDIRGLYENEIREPNPR